MIYLHQKTINFEKLHKELQAACPHYDFVNTYFENDLMYAEVHTTQELTIEEQSTLTALITTHTTLDMETIIRAKVNKSINGANEIIRQFATENILMGITQAGKTKLIADSMSSVMYYCQTGSLYEVLTALNTINITPEMSPFLTTARRDAYIVKFNALLASL
jgi:hypothetical protein